jgi:predicted  nucleic acid-binding Zn-ribbon protein
MKAFALLIIALVALEGASAAGLKARLASKYQPYAGAYDQQYAPQDSYYGNDQFREEPVPAPEEQSPVEDPAAAEQAAEQQGEENASALKPAIIEGAEPSAAEPTLLPPEPVLSKPKGESEEGSEDADASAEETDPEVVKLNTALEAVKEDIISTSKQIADERKWVAAVLKITSSYEEKVKRVQEHVLMLRQEMTKLFKKKKQIENLKLQRALEAKLREANEELSTLQNSLKHVQEKHEELDKSHMDLRSTIADINKQLATLKGEDPAKAEEDEKNEVKEAVEADELEEASTREAAELMADEEKKETFLA